jgi:agmatine deiminase
MGHHPADLGFQHPAEWTPHNSCWLAYPHLQDEWGEYLTAAQAEFIELCLAIAAVDPMTGEARGEKLDILVPNISDIEPLQQRLGPIPVRFHLIAYDDGWLRDAGPIFVRHPEGQVAAVRFQFNAWGGKFTFDRDPAVAMAIAKSTGLPIYEYPVVLEGGSIDTDGEGTALTTRQCLLNPNRNPTLTQQDLEQILHQSLGYEKVLWLADGLLNDHTDGHIDMIARFVAPGIVLCMHPADNADPNKAILERIIVSLQSMTDAQGRTLQVRTIPSPGQILDNDGELLAASYVNFYIGNHIVAVPTYGVEQDAKALAEISACFPDRETVGCPAKAFIAKGGAFHCITQQQPL